MRLALLASLLLAAPTARAQTSWTIITGRVVDAETGTPIAGVRVVHLMCVAADRPETCAPTNGSQSYPLDGTDADGHFDVSTIRMGLRAHAVRVRHAGYCDAVTPPYDEGRRRALWSRLHELLISSVWSRTDLTEEQKQDLFREQSPLRDEVLPVPHAEIALRRPPCAPE